MKPQPEISEYLESRIIAGDFPSAVYLLGEREEIAAAGAVGKAVVEPEAIAATADTIYDLASLTKVLVTTLIIARMIERGAIGLDDAIGRFFPEFAAAAARDVTVRNLLTHNSGFRNWLPFYLLTDRREKIPAVIAAEPETHPRGSKVVYSDLNFLLLTFLIERTYGKRIGSIANDEILGPLGLRDTFFNPPIDLRPRIAASELGNAYEKNTCAELGFDVGSRPEAFRESMIWGEVHDGNCWFMGGESGHAGLFSTAVEILRMARQFLPKQSELLEAGTCAMFRANYTQGLNEARSVGFQLAATPDSSASPALAADSYGHLGFTGTSVWIEPGTERIFVLLTNRTHHHSLPFVIINRARRRFHELAVEFLDARSDR